MSVALPLPRTIIAMIARGRTQFTHEEESYEHWAILGSLAGNFDFALDGEAFDQCRPRELVIVPPGHVLRRRTRGPVDFFFFIFRWKVNVDTIPSGRCTPHDTARVASSIAFLEIQLSDPARQEGWSDWLVFDLLNQIAFEARFAARTPRTAADRLMHVAATALSDFSSSPISLEALAGQLGIDPFQFSRRFRTVFGITPSHYRTRARIDRARRLLLDSAWTLEHIADECHFGNAFYFSRVFSRTTGVSPSAYRRQSV